MDRIIFDLDDTLIPSKDSRFDLAISDTLSYFEFDNSNANINKMLSAINDYPLFYDKYTYADMKKLISSYLNITLPDDFIDIWLERLKSSIPEKKDFTLIDTLNKLSLSYDLVIFTDWFSESQIGRLKNYGISDYFCEVISSDVVRLKPNYEGFIKASSGSPKRCLMVGDSYQKDIKPAMELGMDVILVDKSDSDKHKVKKINKVTEIGRYL